MQQKAVECRSSLTAADAIPAVDVESMSSTESGDIRLTGCH